ncbi:MAG: LacI family transcriptional regulator [Victivallaceae bacterium]|nr:LacI family transcriptional regulator [Victivallaceae bacterium]
MPENKKNVTLKDIAKHIGVSIRTVSLAAKGEGRMAPDTRKKILKVIEEWNYRPNIMARGLVNKKNYLLGVIFPYVSISFYSDVLAGIEERCKENFYDLILKNSGEDFKTEEDAVSRMLDRKVDGIICYPNRNAYSTYKKVIDAKIPLVQITRKIEGIDAPYVMTDGKDGVFQAVKKLIENGRRKIIYLGAGTDTPLMNSRRSGYHKAIVDYGLGLDFDKYEIQKAMGFERGYETTMELFKKGLEFDAIMTCSDETAIGAIKACNKFSKNVPGDVSVIGYGDTDIAQVQSQAGLTSVWHPKKDIGYAAFDIFMKLLKNEKVKPQILKAGLTERDTTL